MKPAIACMVLLLAIPHTGVADSIYDLNTVGNDIVPCAGIGHLVAGASIANPDVASAYTTSPAASAFTDRVVVTIGMLHHATTSDYSEKALTSLGSTYRYEGAGTDPRQESNASTRFPTLAVILPLRAVNIFTGYFVEKMGRADLNASGTAYGTVLFDAHYTKESSVFSIPLFVSTAYRNRLAVSGGLLFSYLDTREERDIDFRSEIVTDITDAVDTYAAGTAWALGALVDYDFVRVGASIRSGSSMSGHEEQSSDISGIWKTRSIDIETPASYKVGAALVTDPVTLEFDYETSPWSKLKIGDSYLSLNEVSRYAVGLTYTGRHIWNAGKFPLHAGFYRQPLDRRSETAGETTETGYTAGTSLGLGNGQAVVVLGLEYVTRKTDGEPDLHEGAFGFYLSVSVGEVWRGALK